VNIEVSRKIRADHPSLPGHFPGAPIVPAVVILDEVLAAVREWRADSRLIGIPVAKFLAPLRPDHPFTISLSAKSDAPNEIGFHCRLADRLIAEGRLQIDRD
jgi:3-hydroxymyristoyl/3-hydroxydecanoyl-(acyl carrier protein) dehydratase